MEREPIWFHCTFHTYGAWPYGDPRGFRTRRHREHVEGDYKHRPPVGTYRAQHERSQRLLVQDPVVIPRVLRPVAGAAIRAKLLALRAQLICLSVGGQHVHLLTKMPPGPTPMAWLGHAKVHSNFALKARGWAGKLWAVRGKANRIKDRAHQVNVFYYILRHADEGAWVWSFRDSQ